MQLRKTAAAGLLCLIALCLSLPAAAADLDGLPVTRIILKDDQGRPWPDAANLLTLTQVRPGEPFSRDAVSRGITYLYLKKLFRDVRVDAFPEDGGVRLEYTLVPLIFVDRIVLQGNDSLPDRDILASIPGIEGRELREDTFPDIRTNIQTRYQEEGFYNVLVSVRSEPAKAPYRADLFISITEPKRTVIAEVRFKGNQALSGRDLIKVMKNRKGRPLRTNVLFDEDLPAIQKRYAAAGYPAAKPGPVSIRFQEEQAFVEIDGTEGPKVTVSFSGNREFSDKELREMLLIWSEHDVSEAVVESSMDNIRNAYRDGGYADVKVDVKRTEGPGTLYFFFSIDEGPHVTVRDVRIEGDTVFTAKDLLGMINTRPSVWYWFSHPYREDVLDKDLDLIDDRYTAAGYPAAEAKRTVTRSADGRKADIVIKISEGRRMVTGSVTFEGNAVATDAELLALLKLRPGTPFNERVMEEDRDRIMAYYAGKGYIYARVEAEKQPMPSTAGAAVSGAEVVNVHYRIVEDELVRVGTVILRGNLSTRDYVILRELRPKTGEPYNYEAMLKSQQRVYRYGYFSQAKFEPVHPSEKEAVKDMLFTVDERPAGAVDFGVGYGNLDRLRGFIQVSHRNIAGTGRYASFRVEGSYILERVAFTLEEPWFLGHENVTGRFILAWSDAKRINQQTREIYYQTRKDTTSYGIERTDGRLKTSLTYAYEIVTNYNVQQAAELTPQDSGHVLISSLSPAVVWDLRDDPFNPTRGSVHGATFKQAMDLIGSKADFTKVTAQTSWFFPLAKFSVLALSARAGMAWPHKDTTETPINERFYLGGGTTVRGYLQDSIGPPSNEPANSSKVPTGGSSMVQLNAETRINAVAGIGFVLFVDAGNVWVNQQIDLTDLRASYGAGLRYSTPVGPLRIDYGIKINRQPGESRGEVHFNIGHAF